MKFKLRRVYFFILMVIAFNSNAGETGYSISIDIEGAPDSMLFLASYFGKQTVINDTAFNDGKGSFVFAGKEDLDRGIYIVASEKKSKYFEFLINDEQNISFKTNIDKYFLI